LRIDSSRARIDEIREEREIPKRDEREYVGDDDLVVVGHAYESFHVRVC
jgi:hypothetical protein